VEVEEEERELWKTTTVAKMMGACIHIIPSGSGTVVDQCGVVLTCAHAVAADGDPEEDEAEAGVPPPDRLGRYKTLVAASGEVFLAVCTAVDETADVAALQMVWSNRRGELLPTVDDADGSTSTSTQTNLATSTPFEGHVPLAPGPPNPATDGPLPVGCIGNPYDWDLERPSGARPTKMERCAFFDHGFCCVRFSIIGLRLLCGARFSTEMCSRGCVRLCSA
jgi:hypothetical protein